MTPPLVFVTVDTEEDDWGDYLNRDPGVTNVARLPAFQQLCDRYGVVPTYFVNWQIVRKPSSRSVVRELAVHRRCEIGTHIHAWHTPPVTEAVGDVNSMLCNLPEDLVAKKLASVHDLIVRSLDVTPTVFRAGRWGFGPTVARVLPRFGYQIDSSVTPLIDWSEDFGPDYRQAPSGAFRFHPSAPLTPDPDGSLVEIPLSIGFLNGQPHLRMKLRGWAERAPRHLRVVGILDRLHLAALRWLSPEESSAKDMIRLARSLVGSGEKYLHLTLHSPTLVAGLTPFTETERDVRMFLDSVEEFFAFASGSGYRFEGLARGAEILGLVEPVGSTTA